MLLLGVRVLLLSTKEFYKYSAGSFDVSDDIRVKFSSMECDFSIIVAYRKQNTTKLGFVNDLQIYL